MEENGKNICVLCGNNQENLCIAGRVDSFAGMTITQCPDFKKDYKKTITIREDGMRELIKEYFECENPTDKQISEFMDFLELDVTNWITDNWGAFREKEARDGVKFLMAAINEPG